MYTYENNPVMLTQIVCVTLSLLSIIGVIIVFFLGKGQRYFIVILFFTQIICMFFFYIPQLLGPFLISDHEGNNNQKYCNIPEFDNQGNQTSQECIPDQLCRLQSYFVNSAFVASSLISLYSCYVIKQTLCLSTPLKNKNQIYWIHFYIGLITFITCLPMLFIIDYKHYGVSWRGEKIYFICNISLDPTPDKKLWTFFIFYVSIVGNLLLLISSLYLFWDVKRQKKRLNTQLTLEINQYSALNLYVSPLTFTGFWSLNLLMKIIDNQTSMMENVDYLFFNCLWFLPQILITLQGFNYASIFFYSFHSQLVPNLPKSLRPLYIFFAKISIYNLIFGKITVQKVSSESLLYDADSAKESTSSYIQKDESSANR